MVMGEEHGLGAGQSWTEIPHDNCVLLGKPFIHFVCCLQGKGEEKMRVSGVMFMVPHRVLGAQDT